MQTVDAVPTTVAYVIERAINNGAYTDQANILLEYDSCDQDKLHKTFIKTIVLFMDEFCDNECGHGISITSYEDFCRKYYQVNGQVADAPLFLIRYFINGIWKTWEPELYDSEIYATYML